MEFNGCDRKGPKTHAVDATVQGGPCPLSYVSKATDFGFRRPIWMNRYISTSENKIAKQNTG